MLIDDLPLQEKKEENANLQESRTLYHKGTAPCNFKQEISGCKEKKTIDSKKHKE